MTALSISRLRSELNGRVIAPGDSGYDAARTVFYGGIDRRPGVIVRAANATDVARVVSLAQETDAGLAIRSAARTATRRCRRERQLITAASGWLDSCFRWAGSPVYG